MSSALLRFVVLSLFALVCACGQQGGGEIGAFTCGTLATGTDGSAEVDNTIDALVPSGLPDSERVHCTEKQKFSFQGRDVFLVYVSYGNLNDCPAGCFSSMLCAIYDQSQAQLYTAAVNFQGEQPNGVPSDCHSIRDGGHASDCSYQPPGQSHPIVQTAQFQSFRSSQETTGAMRQCFYY